MILDEEYARKKKAVIPKGRYTALTVSDTGSGISADHLPHIFDPFYTTKPSGKGTGLGLATVYGIVKQNHGFVWAYGELGMETVFKVYFPCVRDHGAALDEPEPLIEAIARGTETLLLVEDEDTLRQAESEFLGLHGYTVLQAKDGLDAIAVANNYKSRIHLAITDVVMPRVSGGQLAKELAAVRKETRVLFVSGYSGQTVIDHKVGDAESNFLEKPFTLKQLAGKVRAVLDLSRNTVPA